MSDPAINLPSAPAPSKLDVWIVLAARYAGIGFSFIVSVLVAHGAPQNVVGLFFWVIAISSFLAIPASFGLNSNVHAVLAMAERKDPLGGRNFALRGVAQSLMIGIASIALMLGICGLLPLPIDMLRHAESPWVVLITISIYSAALAVTLVQAEVYRYRNQHLLAGLSAGVLNNCFFVAGFGALLLLHQPISTNLILVTLAVSGVLGATPALVSLYRVAIKGTGWGSGISIVRMSTPATMTNLCAYLVTQAQGIMGGIFLVAGQYALLGSASRLSMVISLSGTVVLQTPLAASVRAIASGSRDEAQKIMSRAARNAVFVVIPFVIVILFFGPDLLALVFGSLYREGGNTLRVLAIAALVNAAKGSPGQVLMNAGFAHLQMRLTIVGAIFALLVFALAGLTHTPIGLAYAVLAAVTFQAFIERRAAKQQLGMNISFTLAPGRS